MILEYKNNEGYIYAYISWNVIDMENMLVDDGEIVAITGAWVHPRYRHLGILKKMIQDVFYHETTQKSLYVLSYREKYPNRPVKLTPISRYLKYIGGYDGKRKANSVKYPSCCRTT